jgi:hypothetical protein
MLAVLAIFSATLLIGSFAQVAFSVNPYVGGYVSNASSKRTGFNERVDFSNVGSGRSYNLASVITAAGFASSTATNPTGWSYQQAVDLKTDNVYITGTEVYNMGVCAAGCTAQATIGTHGTGNNDVNFVYTNMWWGSTKLSWFFEKYENDGGIVALPIIQYDAVVDGPNDPSRTLVWEPKRRH